MLSKFVRLNIVFILFHSLNCWAQSNSFTRKVNGSVGAIEVDTVHDIIYVGGAFERAGNIGSYGALTNVNGEISDQAQFPNGQVRTSLPDGKGGFYIGGEFTEVGGMARGKVAHIDANGALTDWGKDLNFNHTVNALAIHNDKLYVGGDFTAHDSFTNSTGVRLAKSDLTPDFTSNNINDVVRVSISDGKGGVYIGGDFTMIDGQKRHHLAHIDASGNLSEFRADTDWPVLALELHENTLYIGGRFRQIAGKTKDRVAAIDITTNEVTNWSPQASGTVYSLLYANEVVYIGGNYTTIGGQSRANLAAVDAYTGLATSWVANTDKSVFSLAKKDNHIYVGGSFTTIGSSTRNYFAQLNETDGSVSDWDIHADGLVRTLKFKDNQLFVGGEFTSIMSSERKCLAVLDMATLSLEPWQIDISGVIYDLHIDQSRIFAVGAFTSQDGQYNRKIVSVDLTNANEQLWIPALNNIFTITDLGSSIFIGGDPQSIGGNALKYLAAVDIPSEKVDNWNMDVRGAVKALLVADDRLYVGGDFLLMDGKTRQKFAEIDLSTRELTSFDIAFNSAVQAFIKNDETLYVGGRFSNVAGQIRLYLASIDLTTSSLTNWDPRSNAAIYAFYKHKGNIYVAGGYDQIAGQSRNFGISSFDPQTGHFTNWFAQGDITYETSFTVYALNDRIYIGGHFHRTTTSGTYHYYLKVFDDVTGEQIDDVAADYLMNNRSTTIVVNTITGSGTDIYYGGNFKSIGGQRRKNLAAFNAISGELLPWNPSPNQEVTGITSDQDSLIYIGGRFSHIGGKSRNRLAAISATTGLATEWNPDIQGVDNGDLNTGYVKGMIVQGGKLYIAGDFVSVGAEDRGSGAIVDLYTAKPEAWNPDIKSCNSCMISTMQIHGDKLYLAGSFGSISGQNRSRLASYTLADMQLTNWAPQVSGLSVNTIEIKDGLLYAGGDFNSLGGKPRVNLGAIDLQSGLAVADWQADTDDEVLDVLVKGSDLIVAGEFSQVAGHYRNRAAAVKLGQSQLRDWDALIEGVKVATLEKLEGRLLLGGEFEMVGYAEYRGLTDVDTRSTERIVTLESIADKTYGDAPFTLSANYSLTDGLVFKTSDPNIISIQGDQATIVNAGTVTIEAFMPGDDVYADGSDSQVVVVNKASLDVQVDDVSIVYGDIPVYNFQYSGFINGDDQASAAIEAPQVTADHTQIGTSTIDLSGGSAPNYNLVLTNGQLNVAKADLSVRAMDATMQYGDILPDFELDSTGFKFDDNVSDITEPLVYSLANSFSEAGTYALKLTGGNAAKYNLIRIEGELTIGKRDIVLTADPKSKVYGDPNPELTYSIIGMVNGDTYESLDTEPALSTDVDEYTGAGEYAIVVSGGEDNNYAFQYQQGILQVNKATLEVTLNNVTIQYGSDLPAFAYSITGFRNGDNSSDIDTWPQITTPAGSYPDAGIYDVIAEYGMDDNYDFRYTNAKLAVQKAPLAVVADDQSRPYQSPNPVFTVTYHGFVLNDNASDLDQTPLVSTEATVESDAGNYQIVVNDFDDRNYVITVVAGNLSITKADQNITFELPDNITMATTQLVLNATASSGLDIYYETDNDAVAIIEGTILKILSSGELTISAYQQGNKNYNEATPVSRTLTISDVTGLVDISDNISLYPNPANKSFILDLPEYISINSTIVLVDNHGRVVKSYQAGELSYNIDSLDEGLYLVILTSGEHVGIIGKLMIQR